MIYDMKPPFGSYWITSTITDELKITNKLALVDWILIPPPGWNAIQVAGLES